MDPPSKATSKLKPSYISVLYLFTQSKIPKILFLKPIYTILQITRSLSEYTVAERPLKLQRWVCWHVALNRQNQHLLANPRQCSLSEHVRYCSPASHSCLCCGRQWSPPARWASTSKPKLHFLAQKPVKMIIIVFNRQNMINKGIYNIGDFLYRFLTK
jgi:hypothetical protein